MSLCFLLQTVNVLLCMYSTCAGLRSSAPKSRVDESLKEQFHQILFFSNLPIALIMFFIYYFSKFLRCSIICLETASMKMLTTYPNFPGSCVLFSSSIYWFTIARKPLVQL